MSLIRILNRYHRPAGLLLGCLLFAGALEGAEPKRSVSRFTEHIEAMLPELLAATGARGAAVAVVHHGRLVYVSGFGLADEESHTRVQPDTLFNVGSISKTLTAWGVLALVESGRLHLDNPVAPLVEARAPEVVPLLENVTLRNLLDHTSGLTAPSVPEYLPWESVPSLAAWLASGAEVQSTGEPGAAWSYSGAGYSVLQVILEAATGETFDDYMKHAVFAPLGMTRSTFEPRLSTVGIARPHDDGRPIPYRRYAGLSAAGLYTSARDLGHFLEAHASSDGRPTGRRVVSSETLAQARTANPVSRTEYNTTYGLGYSIWPLAGGELTSGHRGQNHGWSAVAWLSSDGTDGVAVLTNDSQGEDLYRWIFCDWAHWLDGAPSFGGYCRGRADAPAGTLFAEGTVERTVGEPAGADEASRLVEVLQRHVPSDGPGFSALVAQGDRTLVREAWGSGNLSSGMELTSATPFYLASLAKPLTATVILDLVARGALALDDRVERWLPDSSLFSTGVTVRQLLTHTGGVPDLWRALDWSRLEPLDNASALRLVSDADLGGGAPGASFEYSNTGYIALAYLAERVTGRSFGSLLYDDPSCPPSSSSLYVLDEPDADLPQRARGHGVRAGELRLVDYRRLELPGVRPVEPRFSTVGAGGVVGNVDGVHCWARRFLRGYGVPAPLHLMALDTPVPAPGVEGFGERTDAGPVLFAGTLAGRRVLWFDGALFGHRSLLVIEPQSETVVVLLANTSDIDLRGIARELFLELL